MVNAHSLAFEEIYAPGPVIDISKCRYCGVCSGYCPEKAIQFNRYVPSVTLIVSMCFGCGNCIKGCDHKGISMQNKLSGKILQGRLNQNYFIAGELAKGSEFKKPLLIALNERLLEDAIVICDFAPGIGSSVSVGLSNMDLAIVVLQPEYDWEQNLTLMLNTLDKSSIPFGVIINKVKNETELVKDIKAYFLNQSIPLSGIIPFTIILEDSSDFTDTGKDIFPHTFSEIWERLKKIIPASVPIHKET